MDEKARYLQGELERRFGPGHTAYVFNNELHKYKIDRGEKAPVWLYVEPTYLDDHNQDEIFRALEMNRVFEKIAESEDSKWIVVDSSGAHDEDPYYGHDYD